MHIISDMTRAFQRYANERKFVDPFSIRIHGGNRSGGDGGVLRAIGMGRIARHSGFLYP